MGRFVGGRAGVVAIALAAALLGGCSDGGTAPVAAPEVATSYPLEVLGGPGTEVRATLRLSAADLAMPGAVELALTVHNVLEPGSALVSVNGGAGSDLGATSLAWQTGGVVTSGRVPIERALLREGDNELVFRHEQRVVDVLPLSGFRVLSVAIELGDHSVPLVLPEADPGTFSPVRSDAATIERGRSFFRDVSRDGGPTCNRCHTPSGADLAYYGFSNHALVERAMFHGFSQTEAEDIASYVRTLEVESRGRAHAAPFQPGEENAGAAGAGARSVLAGDGAFALAAFGAPALPVDLAWDWAGSVDTFRLPTRLPLLTWHRFVPRTIDPSWFALDGGALEEAELALAAEPSLDNASSFMNVAVSLGRRIFADTGNHPNRIDLLRYAAVRLWDWSRLNGFDDPDHGFVDGEGTDALFSPPFPYEVGFAFFEAGDASIPGASAQTLQWWWAQLAVHPGRGLSDGSRPLDYGDVLSVAEAAGAGPYELAFLHLLGTWEDSRGALAEAFGTSEGPVRLLAVPVRNLPPADRVVLFRRFLAREAAFLADGGVLTDGHHALLATAWAEACVELSDDQRGEVVAAAPAAVHADVATCPP